MNYERVSPSNRCPCCQSSSWCVLVPDAVLCMRSPSSNPITLSDGSVGWWHDLKGHSLGATHYRMKATRDSLSPPIHINRIAEDRAAATTLESLDILADHLGVTRQSLVDLGCFKSDKYLTYGFPMRNWKGAVVGIRLRSLSGHKWAEKGSHQGLFMPGTLDRDAVYVVEGPTDCAAALSLGLSAIGRPSCSGGVFDLLGAIQRFAIRRVVIVADNDEDKVRPDGSKYNPGLDGAMALAEHLTVPNCTLLLPTKDIRQFLNKGGTKEMIEYMTGQCLWRNPK